MEIYVPVFLWVVAGVRLFWKKWEKKTYVMHDAYEENDKKAENALSSVK